MWIITGPFDEDHSENQAPDKSKLLKTGREYGLGRRDQPLQIKSKAISKAHALFVVAECTEEQAADPSYVPTLTFHNLTDRVRPVERPSLARPRVLCQPKTSMELENGDIVHLSASIFVRLRWEKMCCYHSPAKGSPHSSVKECASLGIHFVPTLHPDVTHHLTSNYVLSPAIATSVISLATLVKPEWLNAVLSAGRAETGELSSLEENYVLPPTSKYRPTFSPSLPSRLKKFNAWEPNEERVAMFKNHRFIFVGEKGAEAQNALKELVRRGEGDYECFAVEGGTDGLRRVLSKGRARGATLVLVAAQAGVIAAIGKQGWADFVEEAKKFELKFLPPEKLSEAVMCADISYIDSRSDAEEVPQESVLPDVIPNTIEDEPSLEPTNDKAPPPAPEPEPVAVPRRRLPKRAASRASSRAPSPPPVPPPEPETADPEVAEEAPPEPAPAQPRRALVRRARAKVVVENDDSMDIDSARASVEPSGSQEPARQAESVVPPTPSRPSRLKRRVGTRAQSSAANQIFPESEDVFAGEAEEPKHKRFKALFDQSDPDKIAMMNLDEYGSQHVGGEESMTQFEPSVALGSQTQGRSSRSTRSGRSGVAAGPSGALGAVQEEEEESTMASGVPAAVVADTQTQTRGTKRKTQDEDVEMGMADEAPPKTKRRTEGEGGETQTMSETQVPTPTQAPKPMSKVVTRVDMAHSHVHVKPKKTGTVKQEKAGEPDRDDAFLKAVASTKRGKKAEDTFDREFNNLRISKPDLERERENEEFKVLEEFGDDGDMRGNFIVVMEIPLFREAGTREHLRRGEGRLEWQGKPDFKKFKRKALGERRQPIELMVEEENDLGIGSQYWKGATQARPPPSQLQSQPMSEPKSATTTTQKSTQRSTKDRPSLVSDSDEDVEPAAKPARGKSQGKSQGTKPPSTQSRSGTRTRGRAGSQKQPLFIDSDIEEDEKDDDFDMGSDEHGKDGSEEEPVATLKSSKRGTQGSSRGKSGGKKKAPAIVVDDDSDEGGFKAFGSRTRTRRR
ncbi:hypothetical protein C8Q80DRAFT_188092 [Daedaleopsis nitida]|nr:hypothetical protein C8Q80DRAFT_188092 [Daedaleopsis nitida]